jgi:DNA-binding transcriptional MerR regulator
MFNIGELSKQTGVLCVTIRYYEQIGLLPQPERTENGYRIYDEEDIDRLQFIQRARAIEFGLDEIAEILALKECNQAPCDHVMAMMSQRIDEIQERICDLEKLHDELTLLSASGQHLFEHMET